MAEGAFCFHLALLPGVYKLWGKGQNLKCCLTVKTLKQVKKIVLNCQFDSILTCRHIAILQSYTVKTISIGRLVGKMCRQKYWPSAMGRRLWTPAVLLLKCCLMLAQCHGPAFVDPCCTASQVLLDAGPVPWAGVCGPLLYCFSSLA